MKQKKLKSEIKKKNLELHELRKRGSMKSCLSHLSLWRKETIARQARVTDRTVYTFEFDLLLSKCQVRSSLLLSTGFFPEQPLNIYRAAVQRNTLQTID